MKNNSLLSHCFVALAAFHDNAAASEEKNAVEENIAEPLVAVAKNAIAVDDEKATDDAGKETPADDDLLPKKQADMLLMSIAHVMEDTATVCNPDFCLSTLAQLVGSNTKYVSWVINKGYGKNFKTYLNEYRIRTASQLLTDTDKFGNLTIAGIAERVGYKSPASFHQAFKKIYAMTPAAYVKLAKNR